MSEAQQILAVIIVLCLVAVILVFVYLERVPNKESIEDEDSLV